jgi:flagellar FliL protein
MSETQGSDQTQEAAPRRRGGVLIAAVVALLAGGGAGVFAVGPMLAGGGGASHGEEAEEEGDGGHGGGHGGSDVGRPLYNVENLVINPAGTQGTRFLIATVAIELSNTAAGAAMAARDPEIRDVLLNLLASRTVEQLADLGSRDTLKLQIRTAVEGVIGKQSVRQIFIPQYVLQ